MDGLDTPFAQFFGAMFREDGNGAPAPRDKAKEPPLYYPYARARESLEALTRNSPPHPAYGWRQRYTDPATGRDPFLTMAVVLQSLPAGHSGRRYRSTDGSVYYVVEGRGTIEIGETRRAFGPRDVFVVPPWESFRFAAKSDCVIFSYSDRAAQESLGLWREEPAE